jgi:hypothetical protein
MKALAALAALLLCASVAQAQVTDKPLFSKDRASLAVGLDYAAFSNTAKVVTTPKAEWETALYGAYVLTPRFTLAGSAAYLTDSKLVKYRVGLRAVIFRGRD